MGHPGPLGPSRIFLQKAVASGGSNLARLGELGGNHLPYFAINRGGSEEEKGSAPLALLSLSNLLGKIPRRFRNVSVTFSVRNFAKVFDRSSTFFIVLRSSTVISRLT
ncbi:hypothetical protein HKD37_07G018731 [Glycine soja]